MNLALFCILILCSFAKQVRISTTVISNTMQHMNHFALTNIGINKVADSKKYLDDYTLTIPLTLGQSTFEQVIDTTSYITWVFGQSSEGSPKGASQYKCEGQCTLLKKDDAIVHLNNEISFGGRVKLEGDYGLQESVELMALKPKNVGLGIIKKISSDQSVKSGVLGLSYGSEYIEYKNKKNAQVGQVEFNAAMEPQQSVVQQLNSQLSNVPTSTFAIKMENNLQMLIIGEEQQYFAKNKLIQFSNVGKRVWALKLNKLSLGKEGTFLSKGTAVFDSTTRFIWTDQSVVDKFKEQLQKAHLDCNPIDGILKCPCNDEQYNNISDINFSFNLNTDSNFPISKIDYIVREEGQCYILIKILSETNPIVADQEKPVVIIPNTFYKQNYAIFNQNANTISISDAYNVDSDQLNLNNNTLLYTTLIGAALILFTLLILVNCMQKAPYDPDYLHKVPAKPNQVVQYAPQPQQMVVQTISPQRIYQTQPVYQIAQQPIYQGGLFSPYRNQMGQNGQFR